MKTFLGYLASLRSKSKERDVACVRRAYGVKFYHPEILPGSEFGCSER